MQTFIPGLQLSRAFYTDAVRPILREHVPGFEYAAALIGHGSEVLEYDSARSADHHWGPRVMLFATDEHAARHGSVVHEQLAMRLPPVFRGISTNFAPPNEEGTRLLEPVAGPPIAHRVEVLPLTAYLRDEVGFDPRDGISTIDWLFTPSQRLLELTAGDVFDDPQGMLEPVRQTLDWYPHDVWLFLIARQWQRISQEEPFVGRCAEAGDELGSRVVATRLVRDVMRLCFLFERRHAPYSKWLGTAFAQLGCAADLSPALERALAATDYAAREAALVATYELVAAMHNSIGITAPLDATVRTFWDRPYLVLNSDRFVSATMAALDPAFRASVEHIPGGIDQIADSTDVLSNASQFRRIAEAYRR